MTIRVLIVDDSTVMCEFIARKLKAQSDIEVVGKAHDAMEARQLIKKLDPDVVTLDLEMPGLGGLSFLEKIMTLRPTPVTIVSSSAQASTKATARALQLGAVNCYAKWTRQRSIRDDDGGELARLVREASRTKVARIDVPKRRADVSAPAQKSGRRSNRIASARAAPAKLKGQRPDLIAIGSSTGGVEALNIVLSGFPADCPPTLIVQHVHPTFAPAIAQSLDKIAAPRVRLAENNAMLSPGLVLLAPGSAKHLEVTAAGENGYRAVLRDGALTSGHRPSVDRLFGSVARTAGRRALGVILTGMGEDGAKELLTMANAGAHTIAQSQESCVVFGMPRAAIALGAAKSVVPLEQIAKEIVSHRVFSEASANACAPPLSKREFTAKRSPAGIFQKSPKDAGQNL